MGVCEHTYDIRQPTFARVFCGPSATGELRNVV